MDHCARAKDSPNPANRSNAHARISPEAQISAHLQADHDYRGMTSKQILSCDRPMAQVRGAGQRCPAD